MLDPMTRSAGPGPAFVDSSKKPATPLHIVHVAAFEKFKAGLPAAQAAWLDHNRFAPRPGSVSLLPGDVTGPVALVIVESAELPWDYGWLATRLPRGLYQVENEPGAAVADALCLGWALGSYRFDRYKKEPTPPSTLIWPANATRAVVLALSEGFFLARDLVNTPASDMGPAELTQAAKHLAKQHDAKFSVIVGKELLRANYPMIHAVGRASSREPALVDLRWGKSKHPKVTLVGKGVCFDTGGLDLKPPQAMKLMKKDMGGAAFVLGLAHVIMSRNLPVRLRVLIPAVENSVSGDAMRPLDVLPSRKGLTVEVGDTDAEGRLVLADALTEADSENPDLIIDAATLTGAARVALGTAMPAIFATRTESWQALERASLAVDEPLWRLPLHKPYRNRLDSAIADLSNIGGDSYGGAITAALFLQEFTSPGSDWVHMDTMGYNLDARAGRPVGGEALGLLALDRWLCERYGSAAETGAAETGAAETRQKVPTAKKPARQKAAAKPTPSPKKKSAAAPKKKTDEKKTQ